MKDLPKEAPEEVRNVAQALIAKYEKARKDARSYIYFERHESERIPEEWDIADSFEKNEALVFKVAPAQWFRRSLSTGRDSHLGGIEAALAAVRTWKVR